jgi:hypothetical protein
MSGGCVWYICVREWLFVENVCLLGVDMCGGPAVSENGREDVIPRPGSLYECTGTLNVLPCLLFLCVLFPLEPVLEM